MKVIISTRKYKGEAEILSQSKQFVYTDKGKFSKKSITIHQVQTFVKGSKERSLEVIEYLKSLGASNWLDLTGEDEKSGYYINLDGDIDKLPITQILYLGWPEHKLEAKKSYMFAIEGRNAPSRKFDNIEECKTEAKKVLEREQKNGYKKAFIYLLESTISIESKVIFHTT